MVIFQWRSRFRPHPGAGEVGSSITAEAPPYQFWLKPFRLKAKSGVQCSPLHLSI
jgi:hypothetical protein